MRDDVKNMVYQIVKMHEGPITATEIIEELPVKATLQRVLSYLSQLRLANKIERVARGRYMRINA